MTVKESLAIMYRTLIGYDPFEDNPSITEQDVARILAEYVRERFADN